MSHVSRGRLQVIGSKRLTLTYRLMYSKRYMGVTNKELLLTNNLETTYLVCLLSSSKMIINYYLHPIYLNFTSHCVMSISILLENYRLFKVVFIYSSMYGILIYIYIYSIYPYLSMNVYKVIYSEALLGDVSTATLCRADVRSNHIVHFGRAATATY